MANNKQKLELTWIGKGEMPKLEPRILIEDPEKSYGDTNSQNMLIHGDNLLALKALEQDFAGKIKCIVIDPPYNTGNAFEHYDDSLEHSTWLNLIKPRIEILRNLLSEDGTLWICIDDDECHYLKVLCDEVFGRKNFVNNIIWEKKYSTQNDAKWLSDSHDHILLYAKNKNIWTPNLLPRSEKQNKYYKYDDKDGRGLWRSDNILVKSFTANRIFAITNPNTGTKYFPPEGRCWRYSEESAMQMLKENRFYFGKDGKGAPQVKRYLLEVKDGLTSRTIFFRDDVGDNQEAKNETTAFNSKDIFATPKPERLLERILYLGSSENDIVLDSFLGSGTTSAVAHKMGRKWIGIELGDHCDTHCLPRLKKVVDGTDQGGISETMNWKGGGGFKYYYLAPSLLKKDEHDNWIIEPKYNADMLSAAMAKQEGFNFQPDETTYWKQGKSTEKDFIFTTTSFVTVEMIDKLKDEMLDDESLLICCKAFQEECSDKYSNITIKKIPNMLLGKCEFGKEDYSLNIINVPMDKKILEELDLEFDKENEVETKVSNSDTISLFDNEVE